MSPLPTDTNPQTVAWTTSNARIMFEDQERRASSLETRAGQLAGFTGLVLALIVPLGVEGIHDASWDIPVYGLIIVASASAVFALFSLVHGVLAPAWFVSISSSEIDNYINDSRFQTQPPEELQIRTLKAIRDAVKVYEVHNEKKAKNLNRGVYGFSATLLASIALVGVISAEPEATGLGTEAKPFVVISPESQTDDSSKNRLKVLRERSGGRGKTKVRENETGDVRAKPGAPQVQKGRHE
ncbi:MAG: hypothetical protein JJE13_09025 [Thermoleophilia bacterium]|nr:hypothetical protein [Thermoleophilia bacterium]